MATQLHVHRETWLHSDIATQLQVHRETWLHGDIATQKYVATQRQSYTATRIQRNMATHLTPTSTGTKYFSEANVPFFDVKGWLP